VSNIEQTSIEETHIVYRPRQRLVPHLGASATEHANVIPTIAAAVR
jgi:hypothetical protein